MYEVGNEIDSKLKAVLGIPNLVLDFMSVILIKRFASTHSTCSGSAILCDLIYKKIFDFPGSTGRFIHQEPWPNDITP